jgi:hypothetical protein
VLSFLVALIWLTYNSTLICKAIFFLFNNFLFINLVKRIQLLFLVLIVLLVVHLFFLGRILSDNH